MNRNIKLLWGVIGFGVLMGLILPSRNDSPSAPDTAELQTGSERPAAPAISQSPEPTVKMSAEMPTDFTIAPTAAFSNPTGIDGSPTAVDVSVPEPIAAPSPPPAQPISHSLPPGSVGGSGKGEIGPPVNPTILH